MLPVPGGLKPDSCQAECLGFVEDQAEGGMWCPLPSSTSVFDLKADIVTVAKGIASGLPLSVTAARADVMNCKAVSPSRTRS